MALRHQQLLQKLKPIVYLNRLEGFLDPLGVELAIATCDILV